MWRFLFAVACAIVFVHLIHEKIMGLSCLRTDFLRLPLVEHCKAWDRLLFLERVQVGRSQRPFHPLLHRFLSPRDRRLAVVQASPIADRLYCPASARKRTV